MGIGFGVQGLGFGGKGENNYFTEMCSGSEAGSYLRRIDFVYHSTLGLRVIKKKVLRVKESTFSRELKRMLPRHCFALLLPQAEGRGFLNKGTQQRTQGMAADVTRGKVPTPLSSEHGTYKTVKARF